MAEFSRLQGGERAQDGRAPKTFRVERASHDLLKLQRLAGNAAVSSLLVQREGDPGQALTYFHTENKPGSISVKLKGGQVIDASAQIG